MDSSNEDTWEKNKTRRITEDQRSELIRLVRNDEERSKGKEKCRLEKKLWWGEAAIRLNNMRGPSKSPAQWIKTYSDMVKNRINSRSRKPWGTKGNGGEDSSLAETDIKIKAEAEGTEPWQRSDTDQDQYDVDDEVPYEAIARDFEIDLSPSSIKISERQAVALEAQARAAERQAAALERQAAAAEKQAQATELQTAKLEEIAQLIRGWQQDKS